MNAVISEADFRKQIGKTAGKAYLFFGKEDYLKAHAVKQTRAAICEDATFAVFNDITIDAADFTPDGLLNAMSPPPMMADGKLILLRGLDLTSMKPQEVDALIETLAILPEYDYNTVLLYVPDGQIDTGSLPKRPSPLFKKLSEVLIPVRFDAPTPARLCAWAGKHFVHLGVQASPDVCGFLVSYVGESMFRLSTEIEKLAYYVQAAGRTDVSEQDVRLVTVPQLQNDAFALSNAILAGKYTEALEVLSVMKFERTEPTVVMGELAKTLCDMYAARLLQDAGRTQKEISAVLNLHEYKTGLILRAVSRIAPARLSRAVALCAEADMALKSSYADYAPIEKLICSL